MSCHVYELSCIWVVMSMSYHVYEVSCLLVFMSMSCRVYELSCRIVFISISCCVYELSCLCLSIYTIIYQEIDHRWIVAFVFIYIYLSLRVGGVGTLETTWAYTLSPFCTKFNPFLWTLATDIIGLELNFLVNTLFIYFNFIIISIVKYISFSFICFYKT